MTEKAKKYLSDILQAIKLIDEFSKEVSNFSAYQKDLKSKSAIERQLGIIGEAVNQLRKEEKEIKLGHARQMVNFRNRLIHSYDNVDDSIVWVIVKKYLPPLHDEVNAYLNEQ